MPGPELPGPAEIGHLERDGVKLSERRFTVIGKGNRERCVGFGSNTGLALARYLKQRDQRAVQPTGALWLNRRGRPLTVDGIKDMLNRRGREAGVSGSLHAHRFRHHFSPAKPLSTAVRATNHATF